MAPAETVTRIPGPAGALQEALRRGEPAKHLEDGAGLGPEGARSGTPGVGTLARPAAFAGDSPWFKLGAWRRLLDALDLEAFDPASPLLRTNVAWILNGGWRGQRVHRLAVVVQDAFETAFGDLKVVLADPTGSIRCTVHRDVAAADPRAFRKGGALLLQNVPVLTLAEFTEHYLVVAENELVQTFEPDEAGAAAERGGRRETRRRGRTRASSEPRADLRLPGIEPRGEGRPAEELAREMHDAVVAVERAQAELDREREAEMAARESRKREPEPEALTRGRAGPAGARGGRGGRGGERVRARGREPAQAEIGK
jgi:hypothetical protein